MATTPRRGADGGKSSFCNCSLTFKKSAGRHALSARTQAVDVQAKRSAGLQVVVFSIGARARCYARADRLVELLARSGASQAVAQRADGVKCQKQVAVASVGYGGAAQAVCECVWCTVGNWPAPLAIQVLLTSKQRQFQSIFASLSSGLRYASS